MTDVNEFIQQWNSNTPEERRARLNELGARFPDLGEDEKNEHAALATSVAQDEEAAAEQRKLDEAAKHNA